MASKTNFLFILVILALLCDQAKAGYVNNTTLRDYMWNWFLWYVSTDKMIQCNWAGLWGLLWLNDNGAMAENCFRTDI